HPGGLVDEVDLAGFRLEVQERAVAGDAGDAMAARRRDDADVSAAIGRPDRLVVEHDGNGDVAVERVPHQVNDGLVGNGLEALAGSVAGKRGQLLASREEDQESRDQKTLQHGYLLTVPVVAE